LNKEKDHKIKSLLKHYKDLISKTNSNRSVQMPDYLRPSKVCLDISTKCQLKCPTCPTSNLMIKEGIGSGFLSYEDFERFTRDHPWITRIEISNWGEALLNPYFIKILKCAYEKSITITINNGINFNSASDNVFEAIVKYNVKSITCSIDGASQESYSKYRIKGNFNKVIANIRKLNEYKIKFDCHEPVLTWQYVIFGHNEHEIGKARTMAADLGMKFKLKLSWDDLYVSTFSPIIDKEIIKRETGLEVSTRKEYEEKYGINYAAGCCLNLWKSPNINFDGKLLGCCINYWDYFDNVFEKGLDYCLKSERYQYTKEMLMGLKPERKDIPCINCNVYLSRKSHGSYVTFNQVKLPGS